MAKNVLDKEPKARQLYRAGKSLEQIREKTGISKPTLLKWKAQFDWGVKGAALPELERKAEDAALAAAEARGLSKDFLFGKIADLLNAKGRTGKADLDAIDKGLTHAERTVPGFKVADKIDHTTLGRSLLDEVLDEA